MQSRWLKFIALLLLITLKEPAMGENLTTSEETRSEITALVAAEAAAWNRGSAAEFADQALPDIVFTNIWHQSAKRHCRSTCAHRLDDLQGQCQSSANRPHHISQAGRCDRRCLDDGDGRAASPLCGGKALRRATLPAASLVPECPLKSAFP
jgi:hypothetical protein